MKFLVSILSMLTVAFAALWIYDKPKTIPSKEPSCYYAEQTDFFNHYTGRYKIVMLGTSLTARCHWNELLNRCDIANRGIGGDVTENMVKRIGQVIALNPDTVYIEAGINDLRNGVEMSDIVRHVEIIIDTLKSARICPVLTSVVYVSREYGDLAINGEISALNNEYKSLGKRKAIPYLDLNGKLSKSGVRLSEYTIYDGLHYSGSAYRVWGSMVK